MIRGRSLMPIARESLFGASNCVIPRAMLNQPSPFDVFLSSMTVPSSMN
jgi:hypothetical protein